MSESYIKVSSITHATRAKELLQSKGFNAYIRRTPNPSAEDGCGYSIYFRGDADIAQSILGAAGVRMLGDPVRYEGT